MREKIIVGVIAAIVIVSVCGIMCAAYTGALFLMRHQPEITAAIAPAWLLRKAYLEFFTI